MAGPSLPFVDPADIAEFVGETSFGRAGSYVRRGAVLELDWDAATFRLSGVVRGNAPEPYRCRVELAPDRADRCRIVASACSCPMRYDCKHVAAALLQCDDDFRSTVGVEHRSGDHGGSRARRPARPGPDPGWKGALGPLAGVRSDDGDRPALAAPDHRAPTVPLAVQFELREPVRRRRGPWQAPTTTTIAAERGLTSGVRLTVRPAVRSGTGRWVTNGVGWGSLYHQVHRLNLDEKQVAWFGQFAALGRSVQGVYFGQDPERLVLDDFGSPLLWQLFAEAERLSIALVSNKKDGRIVRAREARVRLDATAAAEGGLDLGAVVDFDGRAVAADAVGELGDHGLYLVEWDPALAITLAPSAIPITSELRSIMRRPPVDVPASDVDEFLREYYPGLARTVGVASGDDSVRFPEIARPMLVTTAAFEPGHVLRLSWEWEYRVGDHGSRAPVASRALATVDAADGAQAGGRPMDATESAILRRVGDELRLLVSGIPEDEVYGALFRDRFPESSSWFGIEAAQVAEHILPLLGSLEDVRVDTVGERPAYRELTGTPELLITTVETDQRDWFDLGILVRVDDYDIPFGPLFAALSKREPKLQLVDGSYLSLKRPVFDRLRELIEEAGELAEWETGPRISRYQASLWADFEDLADQSAPALTWRETVGGLSALLAEDDGAEPLVGPDEEALPGGLQATLRPYQHDGYQWLSFLRRHGLGGILADDMGLGKTIQALAVIARAVETQPSQRFLVVAPTSVVPNWVSEAARFTPGLRVVSIAATGSKTRRPLAELWADADVVVTSYALFRLDFDEYQAGEWAGLVLDEAQFVKNHATKAHRCARDFEAPFKLAITGTPLENNLTELWALFAIVAPGLFPSSRRFTEMYVRPVDHDRTRGDAGELIARLRRRIRPLMLRRTKEAVAPELPPKTEQVLRIDLAPSHRRLYDTFLQKERQKLMGLIDDLDRNRFTVFRSLTLLRMLSLDASLLSDTYASIPSSKLDALFEQLDDVLAEGHRALVFSQFTSFLAKVSARLDDRCVGHAYLDGSTTHREDAIRRFTSGDVPLFLISLKAGGFGLNLTEADYVFLLDPWWNPAAEAQAIDRAHRIGQDKHVMVYRMVSSGTIEEKVLALGEQKARLFDAVMDEGAFDARITAEDIRALLDG